MLRSIKVIFYDFMLTSISVNFKILCLQVYHWYLKFSSVILINFVHACDYLLLFLEIYVYKLFCDSLRFYVRKHICDIQRFYVLKHICDIWRFELSSHVCDILRLYVSNQICCNILLSYVYKFMYEY